jgi:probable HAF family extracellular repeat protein
MIGLGDLPGGGFSSLARGISADGRLIVGISQGANGDEAFVWTETHGIQRLWDVLLAYGANPTADGWTSLQQARAASGDGRFVAGWGTRNGSTEAFLVDLTVVPEPATWIGLALTPVLVALAGWQRRGGGQRAHGAVSR